MANKTVDELLLELESLIRLQVKVRNQSVIMMKVLLNKTKECKEAYKEEKARPT